MTLQEITIFYGLPAFYEARGGERSGEMDFGVWWRTDALRSYTYWRVSVVKDTGDVYAIESMPGAQTPRVIVLGVVSGRGDAAYNEAELLLNGWVDHIHEPNSLEWVRARLGR